MTSLSGCAVRSAPTADGLQRLNRRPRSKHSISAGYQNVCSGVPAASFCITTDRGRGRQFASFFPTRASSTSSENAEAPADSAWAETVQNLKASPPFEIREAGTDDYWDISHVHCHSFYPMSDLVLLMFLRLDRVLALHLGRKIEENRKAINGKYRCLIAAKPNWQPAVPTLGDLALGAVERLVLSSQGLKNEAENGILAAIVVDTLMQYIPRRYWGPDRKATKAYISNLAVGNQLRRKGIGRSLLLQAEQMAVSWGCDEIFLHCDPGNTAAYNLYLRAGYQEIKDSAAGDKTSQPRKDIHLVLMRKSMVESLAPTFDA